MSAAGGEDAAVVQDREGVAAAAGVQRAGGGPLPGGGVVEGGDTEGLAADGFRLVGPPGFVLGRDQWLARYGGGGLVTEKLDWGDVEVRGFGGTAVAIGVHEQVATHQGTR